jgi:hypothetical protein
MLLSAAKSKAHFPDTELAIKVAKFLFDHQVGFEFSKINLRTLKMGYDLALTHPMNWTSLFIQLLPARNLAMADIFDSKLSGEEQFAKFQQLTGLGKRSYFIYKKRFGSSRSYSRN